MKHWLSALLLVASSAAMADPAGVLKLETELRKIVESLLMSD